MLLPLSRIWSSLVILRPSGVDSNSVTSSRTMFTKSSKPGRSHKFHEWEINHWNRTFSNAEKGLNASPKLSHSADNVIIFLLTFHKTDAYCLATRKLELQLQIKNLKLKKNCQTIKNCHGNGWRWIQPLPPNFKHCFKMTPAFGNRGNKTPLETHREASQRFPCRSSWWCAFGTRWLCRPTLQSNPWRLGMNDMTTSFRKLWE